MQKSRYFEILTSKYWNNSAKGVCKTNNDSEGIVVADKVSSQLKIYDSIKKIFFV